MPPVTQFRRRGTRLSCRCMIAATVDGTETRSTSTQYVTRQRPSPYCCMLDVFRLSLPLLVFFHSHSLRCMILGTQTRSTSTHMAPYTLQLLSLLILDFSTLSSHSFHSLALQLLLRSLPLPLPLTLPPRPCVHSLRPTYDWNHFVS